MTATLIYGEERASWTRNHAGPLTFQRRRGELLQRAVDEDRRQRAGIGHNIHIEGVTEQLWLRSPQSRAVMLEYVIVIAAAIVFPIAWPLGRALYRWLARRVDPHGETLHAVPITALATLAAVLILPPTLLLDPSGWQTLSSVIFTPWLWVQGAGVFAAAALYAIMDGWLVVRGATDWWPFPPPPRPIAYSPTKDAQRPNSGPAVPPGYRPPPRARAPRPSPPWDDAPADSPAPWEDPATPPKRPWER